MLIDENTLLDHLYVDFGYNIMRGSWCILSETRSRISNLDKYIKVVNNKVYDTVQNVENGKVYSITLDEKDFDEISDKFFDTITLNIKIGVMCYGLNNLSSYNNSESGITKDGKKHVSIDINVSRGSYIDSIEQLDIVLGHELIHARNDIAMRQKGKFAGCEKGNGNYNVIVDMMTGKGHFNILNGEEKDYVKKLGRILYFLNGTEQKAFLGQCYSELLSKKDNIKDSETAFKAIKETDTWKKFLNIEEKIKEITNVTKPSVRDEVLRAYCIAFGKNYDDYNYTLFLNKLQKKYNDSVDNFFRKVSKMACDAYFSGSNYNPNAYNSLLFECIGNEIETFMERYSWIK